MTSYSASKISLAVGALLMAVKFVGFELTGSEAIFSDAMESVVNVVAALAAFFVVKVAAKPADRDHPYGHGKAEYFSATFEGGLITFAGLAIIVESARALVRGHEIQRLDEGLLIVLGAGIANALLGLFLLKISKKRNSEALRASGHHVLTDFWTSVGIVFGLVIVRFTGWIWLDSVIAMIVALHLLKTGVKIVRRSAGALMDEEDTNLVKELSEILTRNAFPGMIRVHGLKVLRAGHYHHIDAHVVVPEFWDVTKTHNETHRFEKRIISDYSHEGEVHFHVDPCRQVYCAVCDLKDCPVRQAEFVEKVPFSVAEVVNPDEPEFLK